MSLWGTNDPSGLTGDTQSQQDYNPLGFQQPTTTFPGGFPTADVGQQIAALTGAEAGPTAMGPPDIGALLGQQGGAASNPLAGLGGLLGGGSQIGNLLQSLLGPLLGLNQSGAGGEGGQIGGMVGGLAGTLFGPLGTLGGSAVGDLLGSLVGNWVGGGLDKEAKPNAIVGKLETSGNPIEDLLGKYIQNYGINQGYNLSESSSVPFNPAREGNVLQWLTGIGLPHSVTAGGFQNNPTLGGWKNLSQLDAMAQSPRISLNQVDQIKGLIAHLVNQRGGKDLQSLLQEEGDLAQKLKSAESY